MVIDVTINHRCRAVNIVKQYPGGFLRTPSILRRVHTQLTKDAVSKNTVILCFVMCLYLEMVSSCCDTSEPAVSVWHPENAFEDVMFIHGKIFLSICTN